MESCVCIIDRLFQDWIEWIHFTNPIRQQYPVEFQSPSPSQLLRKTLPMESNEKRKIDRINVIDPVLNYLVKFPTINAVFFFFLFNFSKKLCLLRIVKFQHGSRSPASYGTRKQNKNKKRVKICFVFMGGKVRERESATHASVNQSKTKVIF